MRGHKVSWGISLAMLLLATLNAAQAQPHEDALQEAQKLIDQSKQLYDLGKYQQALPVAQQALEIREKELGPEHPDTAEALNQCGLLQYSLGAYVQAESLHRRALEIREKKLGPEHSDTATSLSNLGNVYYTTGAYARAEPIYLRVLAVREKTLGFEHPDTATSLGNLANLYADTGDYAKAESLYRRAVAIREKISPDHPDTATSLSNLASFYHDTGANAKAKSLFERALAIREKTLGPEHPDTADALNNLAVLYFEQGDYAKTESLLQLALSIYEKALGTEHPYTAMSLGNLAELYFNTGAYQRSESFYTRALAIQEKVLGHEHPDVAETLKNLAILYSAAGAYSKAGPLYQRARAVAEKALGTQHPVVADIVNSSALFSWKIGDNSKALSLFEHVQAIQARNIDRFLLSVSEARQQAYLQAHKNDLHNYVSFSIAAPDRRSTALGLTGVLQYKGRVLDATSNNVARLRRRMSLPDRSVFEQLADVASQLSTLTYQGAGNLSSQQYQQRLILLSRQQENLEAKLAQRSTEFRRQVTPITIESVRRAIPVDSVLVEWLRYQPFDPKAKGVQLQNDSPRYVAYVLRHSGELAVIDIGEANRIDELVRKFREALSDPSRSDVKEQAVALSDQVLKPLRTHIHGAQHLLISPDGTLNLLPMAALVDENGRYLAEQTEITYLTSGRDLLRFASEQSSQSAVIANPDYGKPTQLVAQIDSARPQRSVDLDRSGLIFRPLPNTMLEAQALRALLKLDDASVLIGQNATEANIKQLHGPRILHIASHGFFLDDQEMNTIGGQQFAATRENPLLRSGIALAGANERRSGTNDDGILTALEAAQLDLHGTELVVLSACDSGVGQVQNGEGVYGLRRALVLAGAQTEIMSLWKVSDASTSKLMVDYYQRLLHGESRSAALYHAQRTLLETPNQSHPYYWAAFVSIGNPAPLPLVH
jgi:CHAT domain-containing protein/Tfp pilus assembly protein PilF